MPKMQWKTLTDFDMEIFYDKSTWTSFNFTMKNTIKHQTSGSFLNDRQKWVNSTKTQLVTAAKSHLIPHQIEWFEQQVLS